MGGGRRRSHDRDMILTHTHTDLLVLKRSLGSLPLLQCDAHTIQGKEGGKGGDEERPVLKTTRYL